MWNDKQFRDDLESIGEPEVKAILARGDQWATLENRKNVAHEWLRSKEDERRLAREAEILSIAKEANSIARTGVTAAQRSSRYAMYAAIIAAVAAIIAIKSEIMALIFN